jgi:hypothetical protein
MSIDKVNIRITDNQEKIQANRLFPSFARNIQTTISLLLLWKPRLIFCNC